MDRASDRYRSSRKSERDPDPKDRDRDRDREHKHRRRHDEEKPPRDADRRRHDDDDDDKPRDADRRRHDDDDDDKPRDADRHRRAKDRRRSPAASPPQRERRDSVSVDPPRDADRRRRPHADSALDSSPRRERSSDRQLRGSVDRPADDSPPKHHKNRRHYRDDSPPEPEARAKKSSEKHRDSVERGKESSRKRKEYDGGEEDRDERGKRVRDERRERRRFAEDESNGEPVDVEKRSRREKDDYEEEKKSRRERRKFNDDMNSEKRNGDVNNSALEKSGSSAKVPEELLTSKVSMSSAASNLPIPTKVSSITTTNENGVKITRSDEVPGKSSTDGTTASVAGKSGSLDALAKAKKTLQLQKELNEKLKKLPMLNKLPTMKTDTNSQAAVNKVGVKTPTSFVASTTSALVSSGQPALGAATSESISATAGMSVTPGATTTNFEAVKRAQELAAKMGFRQDPEFAPLINMFPGPANVDASVLEKPSKAPVLRLDAQGREVDEHGHVINIPKLTNLSTLKVNINKQKKDSFQILKPELDGDPRSNPHFDASLGIDKTKLLRRPKRNFEFVEEGRWSKQAEIIKFKNQFGDAQAKELKMKQSQLAKAKGEMDNPNLIELPERFERAPKEKKKDDIPEMEWWDKPLLPSGSYIDIGGESMKIDKMTIYVEHPRPIEPPAEPAPPPPQPLKLTKKEQKKLRTQRRLAKEKDRQEMIRQGLIEPPKPKVKMSNLMKVLGSEATQDPTRLEMEIRSAAAEREQAHVDRNIARKLTPAERREKKERKLFEDPNTLETFVSVYKIKDLTDPKTRFKVDVNAQENRLSGVAVISDGITVVVVEGGKKSINRYGKLMLNRIDWAAAVGNGEEGAEDKEVPVNSCGLVWQGSVARPSFHRFNIHQCRTEAAAKKVFADAGVPHYWDLAFNFNEEVLMS